MLNDVVAPNDVVVVFDPRHKEAMAFSRNLNDRNLTFAAAKEQRAGQLTMRDRETASLWERLSGKAIDGKLKGHSILPLISVPWLKERWRQIYPDGVVYK